MVYFTRHATPKKGTHMTVDSTPGTPAPAPAASTPAVPATPPGLTGDQPPRLGGRGLANRIATAAAARQQAASSTPDATTTDKRPVEPPPQDTPAVGGAEVPPVEGKKQESSIKEFDFDGRKVKIDLSKPDAIAKKVVDLDKGMRKAFAERDAANKELAALRESAPNPEFLELATNVDRLNKRFTAAVETGNVRKGVDMVLEELFSPEIVNQWLQHKLQHHSTLLSLSDAEKEQYLKQFSERDAFEQEKLQVALAKAEIEGERNARVTAEQRAEQKAAEALVTPSYRKHSFGEKHPKLDKLLWQEAMPLLKQHVENGNELSQEAVDSIFKGVRDSIAAEHSALGQKAAADAVTAQKTSAMSSISEAVRGGAGQKAEDAAANLLKQNKPAAAFRARLLGRT